MMTGLETDSPQSDCPQSERVNSFLANRLGPQGRSDFVTHLGVCRGCSTLLADLREDARLARIPLTPEERVRVLAVVDAARAEVTAHLDREQRERELGQRKCERPTVPALPKVSRPEPEGALVQPGPAESLEPPEAPKESPGPLAEQPSLQTDPPPTLEEPRGSLEPASERSASLAGPSEQTVEPARPADVLPGGAGVRSWRVLLLSLLAAVLMAAALWLWSR
jgi:hypothetical protein